MEKSFKQGNFNEQEAFILEVLPSKLSQIREKIIPLIDRVLLSMLHKEEVIHKNSINLDQICSKKGIESLKCSIEYYIDDFLVPDAPHDAIEKDTNALKEALEIEGITMDSLNIDVFRGFLTVVYTIPVKEVEQ